MSRVDGDLRDEYETDFVKLPSNVRQLRDIEICDPDLLLGVGGHHTLRLLPNKYKHPSSVNHIRF